MKLFDNISKEIISEKKEQIEKLEEETRQLQESNPYRIPDELSEKGFIATHDALYRLYTGEYYLKIARENSKKFQLNYAWCIKSEDSFNVISGIYSKTKIINEDIEKRNKILGKYTEDCELPRSETVVAHFLNETWQLIFGAAGYLEIFKNKDSEYKIDKYSSNNIMQEYMILSDVIVDNDSEFRLLYVKSENYTLFVDDKKAASFNWQTKPAELLKLDESDDKIQLLNDKLQAINPEFDVSLIKDSLFKNIVELEKDTNKKMDLLNNASSSIKEVIVDSIAILRTKYYDNLKEHITTTLSKHKSPSVQTLADYLNASDEFFVVNDIKKKYRKTSKGFVEIDEIDLSNFFNNEFGFNKIRMKKCIECMDFITRELAIDHDVIQFHNGLYNTRHGEFYEGKFASEYIPKLNLTDFNYVEDAEGKFKETRLYNEIHEILKTSREHWKDWNEYIFYKAVGSCYSASNVADKMFIITGRPWSRKSTLFEIIKRIFNNSCCDTKIQDIVKNERFVLVPTVNKSILIDDDASDLQLNNIGPLNSFVSGTGLFVEFKNVNGGVRLNKYNTPRVWCAANDLFNVVGPGFKRRLCLILADNVFPRNESTKQYMVDIEEGLRDEELELLISYSLQLYQSEKDSAFLTEEQEELMFREFEFKSYPERRFVQDVFTYADELAEVLEESADVERWCITYPDDSVVENVNVPEGEVTAVPTVIIPTFIPKKQAAIICRKYLKYQKKVGTILDSQAIPSTKKIKRAMEMFGYNQTKKYISVDGKRTSIDVFENCVIKEQWIEKLGLQKLYQNIIDDDL